MRRIVSAAALAVAMSTTVEAGVSCYLDVNAGKTITSTRVSDDFSGPVTLAADGLQGGLGAGCDYLTPGLMHGVLIGILGRYDLQDISTGIANARIDSDAQWTGALRIGFKPNEGTTIYGLGGFSWTDITYPGAMEISPRGYVYGAGIELDIGVPNLAVYAEWTHTQWGKASDFGVTLTPDSDTVRVGLKLKFGVPALPTAP